MRKHTDWQSAENEQRLRDAALKSRSIAEVIREIGLVPIGGNYKTIKHHITRLGIDTSHHLGQAWNRENYREPNQEAARVSFKRWLIQKHGHRCWTCGLSDWMGKPIPLELEHEDGNNSNNSWDNLKILCCNCHAQTPTWRRKKK